MACNIYRLGLGAIAVAAASVVVGVGMSTALAQRPIVTRMSEVVRLGCTVDEQSRPREFPWCPNWHSRAIRSVAFSADGQFIASGSVDRTIKIWNMPTATQGDRTRSLVRTLPPNPEQVLSIAFSPDGRLLASGGGRLVRVWDWQRGELIHDFSGHQGIVYQVAFSPDGRTLASAGNDKVIRLWDLGSGELLLALEEDQEVLGLAFSPDGKHLASAGSGNDVKLWDLEEAELQTVLGPYAHPVWAIAFTPDGEHLLFSGKRQGIQRDPKDAVRLWTLEGDPEETLTEHTEEIRAIALSPDGQFVASGGLDNVLKLRHLGGEAEVAIASPHLNEIWALAFHRDGQTLVSGSADNTMKLWRLQ